MNALQSSTAHRLMKQSRRLAWGDGSGPSRSLHVAWIILVSFVGPVFADERPFPENRLRHFYRDQAQAYMRSESPRPSMLSPFPGLDGGAWGHWGQNPESDNADQRLNEVDFGGLLMQVTQVGGREITKGVNVKDPAAFLKAVGEAESVLQPSPIKKRFETRGTHNMMDGTNEYGSLPTRNCRDVQLEGVPAVNALQRIPMQAAWLPVNEYSVPNQFTER